MAQKTSKKKPRSRYGNPQKRPSATVAPPATWRDWVGGARIRTLPLAIAPVIAGTGAALIVDRNFHWVIAIACLIVSVSLQIGVNYANDYSDGIRGTDAHRVGPARLTGAGRAKPRTVLTVALVFFAIAAIVGIAIVVRTGQWWMLAVGAACIVAAWFYTGGKRPYGYAAMGELFVFVFFGLVATLGTTYVQVVDIAANSADSINPVTLIPQEAWFSAVGVGLLACCVLLANNLRDIPQDKEAGKRTLSVLIGRRGTQVLFTVFVLVAIGIAAFIALLYPIAWLTLMVLLALGPAIVIVWAYRNPRELITVLALTSWSTVLYAAFLAWAFIG